MRSSTPRFFVVAVTAAVLLAACGSSSKSESASATTVAGVPATTATGASTDPSVTDATAASDALAPATTAVAAPTSTSPDKPKVNIPATLPTTLVVTDLTPGSGAKAASGDTVIVNYIGVRSADGTEFDNSYDRGQAFPVTLGQGSVIKGWDDGLVGIQQGGRRQLDIPAALAYGDQAKGDVIKANDALTFVIDAVAVVHAPDASKAPAKTVDKVTNVTEIKNLDITTGTGDAAKQGQTAVVHIVAYRGDTGEQVNSSWESGGPASIPLDPTQTLAGLANGIIGMQAGGRRQITLPAKDAFAAAGNDQLGIPADTDLILVIDLLAAY